MTVNMKWILTRLLLLVMAWLPLNSHAEVYKWVDENGRTYYSERPPAANATEVKIKEGPEHAPASEKTPEQINEERDRLLRVYEDERNQKKEEKLEMEKERAKNEQKCAKMENDLKDAKQGGAVYYELDEAGERQYISDDELAEKIEALEKQYEKEC